MKVIILKEDLLKGLSVVNGFTTKSFTLPVLNNILISTEKGFLKLSATNLEIGIRYWVLSQIEEEGILLTQGKTLLDLINLNNSPKITLKNKERDLLIESPNYKTKIKGENPADFPIVPEVKTKKFIIVSNKEVSDSLSQVIDNVSPSQTRPEISGVFFNFKKGKLKIVATDSFRLSEKTISIKEDNTKDFSFILPARAARELINILGEKEGDLIIYISENQVAFENKMLEADHPLFQIVSRLIEGDFPDYEKVIPQEFQTKIVAQRNLFLNEIKKASLFANKINEVKLKIEPTKKRVSIISQNPELGESFSQIVCQTKGKPLEVSFNYRFLLSGISNIKKPEVSLSFTSKEGPALLKPVGAEDFLYIVMPIKST